MEPFGFFSVEALRAGWYLIWRQLVRVLPVGAGSVLVGIFLMSRGLRGFGGFLIGIGLIVAAVWAAVLIPRLTSQWSQSYYGFPLTGGGSLWWNVSWRTWVASFVAAIVLTPPQMVAASLKAAFPGSALGGLGSLLLRAPGPREHRRGVARDRLGDVANRAGSERQLLRYGAGVDAGSPRSDGLGAHAGALRHHAGRRAAGDGRRAGGRRRSPAMAERLAMAEPIVAPQPAARVAVAEPMAAPQPAVRPAPVVAAVEGKRQCPKCSLYETELGKVIGWYCRICGWRESRR